MSWFYLIFCTRLIIIKLKTLAWNKWDKSVFKGGGTHGEITMAYWLGKPVYLVNNLPINDVSSWIFSCSEEIFDNFDNLKKKLETIYL